MKKEQKIVITMPRDPHYQPGPYDHLLFEPVAKGKNYKDYLAQSRTGEQIRRLQENYPTKRYCGL